MTEKRSTGSVPNERRKLQGVAPVFGALALVALVAIAALTVGCGGGSGSAANGAGSGASVAKAGVMSASEAKAFLAAHPEALVLDVREPSEWTDDLGHIDVAKQIPLGELESRVGELAAYKDKPVIAVCRVGMRSARAASYLASQGFTQVSNLNGGMDAWRRAGY